MKKILMIGLTILLSLCTCMGATACKPIERKTLEDYIPETLGKAEGLYLYYDNYRSLTDGTNTERLLGDITVDGVAYTTDEYDIKDIEYMTNKKEIFYSMATKKENEEKKYLLWHYNYDTKEDGLLRVFEKGASLYSSEKYVFVFTPSERVLYDDELNLILEDLSGYSFKDGVVYKSSSNSFEWWRNGKFCSLPINGYKAVVNGKFAYLLNSTFVCAVDLDTGEYVQTEFANGEYFFESLEEGGRTVETGDKTYFITYTKETEVKKVNAILKTGCRLWELQGFNAECIYVFPKKYEVSFSYDSTAEYLNLSTLEKAWVWLGFDIEPLRIWPWQGYYDVQKKKFYSCLMHKTEFLNEPERVMRIGEYEFYVDYQTYGLIMPERFYYLHRVKDGKDEIMLYSYTDGGIGVNLNAVLYDDIYER